MLVARSEYQEGSIWIYAPNKGAPIAFAILFALSGAIHTWQNIKYKSWRVTGLYPWAAILFTAGFILRAFGAFGEWGNLGIFISSTVLLLAGPPVYEAANFLTLGRILYYIPYHSPIHPGRVFTTFLAVGAVIEIFTANGASLSANQENPESRRKTGEALLKTALVLQLVLMAAFVSLILRFAYRCHKAGLLTRKLIRLLTVLLTSCALITARTVFRTVEYFVFVDVLYNLDKLRNGEDVNPLVSEEWFFWVFEVSVMFCNTILLNIFHPMSQLPRSNKIYLAPDGVTEVEGPGFKENRPTWQTFIDPFDIWGMITGRKQERYWEAEHVKTGMGGQA